MKKVLNSFSVAVLAMTTLLMVSCNNKNTEPAADSTDITYSIPNTYDLLSLENITVTYADISGQMITETITATPWNKELKNVKLPFTAKVDMKLTRKDGVKYDKDSYKINTSVKMTVTVRTNETVSSSEIVRGKGEANSSKATIESLLNNVEKMSYKIEDVINAKTPVSK